MLTKIGDTYQLTQATGHQCDRHFTSKQSKQDVCQTFLATPLADGNIQVRAIIKLKFTAVVQSVRPKVRDVQRRVTLRALPFEGVAPCLVITEASDDEEGLNDLDENEGLDDPEKTLGEDSMELNAVDAEESAIEESAFVVKQNLTVQEAALDAHVVSTKPTLLLC
jgi:hypothetical protein